MASRRRHRWLSAEYPTRAAASSFELRLQPFVIRRHELSTSAAPSSLPLSPRQHYYHRWSRVERCPSSMKWFRLLRLLTMKRLCCGCLLLIGFSAVGAPASTRKMVEGPAIIRLMMGCLSRLK